MESSLGKFGLNFVKNNLDGIGRKFSCGKAS